MHSYGTGAIMAVPAHDFRDFDFASKYKLPIIKVVRPTSDSFDPSGAYTDEGIMMNSSNVSSGLDFNGLPNKEAASKIVQWLEHAVQGKKKVDFDFFFRLLDRYLTEA
jgi:leucyl-tRNA synthetase